MLVNHNYNVNYYKMSCKYSEILGVPGKGAHKYGAALDWILTILAAVIIGTIIWHFDHKVPLGFSIFITFVCLYILAIILHYVFCVKSRVSIFLGLIK